MPSTRAKVNYRSPEIEAILENQLKHSLRRIEPDPAFVGHLHNRLLTPAEMTIERRHNTALGLLVLAFSLVSSILIIWLLRQLRAG
jgi:hypothetical protein